MSDKGTTDMILGIAGPSCSGKTTIARLLAERLGAPLLHLDRHWIIGCEKPLVDGHPSYERPHQYDADALREETLDATSRSSIVVVEGFLLFGYPWFAENCTHRFLLDVPHHRLAARRAARHGLSLDDVVGGRAPEADAGWHAHGRSEWEKYGARQRDVPGMITILRSEDGGAWPDDCGEIARIISNTTLEALVV
jgi:hypothetical protein